jgi:putative transposase
LKDFEVEVIQKQGELNMEPVKRKRRERVNFSPELRAQLDQCSTQEDLFGKDGLVKTLIGGMVTYMMEKELESKLGYGKHESSEKDTQNRRNGYNLKKVRSSAGEIELATPRDREGEFEPRLVKKYEKDISMFDDKIISMYAKGMTTRDIQAHVEDIYGVELSPSTISHITDKVMDRAREWQSRPLADIYAVVFFDAIHYKVRENGKIVSKASYTCLGITLEGKKEILGIWIGESEGAKYWLSVIAELKNRGIKDLLIACLDGLKGLPDAINSVFPDTEIQLCIVHMIRNSLKFVGYKNSKEFIKDMKTIYTAPSEKLGQEQLEIFIQKWSDTYPLAVRPWVNHWDHISTFFKFSGEVRRLIYTTNHVEALHRQFRKVTKNRAVFPTDDALLKMLFLAAEDIAKKWSMPCRDWHAIISQLDLAFEGRIVFN